MPQAELQNSIVEWFVLRWPVWTEFAARFFSLLGSEYFYLVILPILFWFAPWKLGLTAARTVILTDLLGEWIKWTVDWPRPTVALVQEPNPGFVSTHAALSMSLAVSLCKRWPKARPIMVFWVLGVAWSRLRLGVHFPLDIAGGWFIGLLVALIILQLETDARSTLYWLVGSALTTAFLWPTNGGVSWQRDMGLLLGLEIGLTILLRYGPIHLPSIELGPGILRLLVLLALYLAMKLLSWPALLRYFLLGLVVSIRRSELRRSPDSDGRE